MILTSTVRVGCAVSTICSGFMMTILHESYFMMLRGAPPYRTRRELAPYFVGLRCVYTLAYVPRRYRLSQLCLCRGARLPRVI